MIYFQDNNIHFIFFLQRNAYCLNDIINKYSKTMQTLNTKNKNNMAFTFRSKIVRNTWCYVKML